MHLPRYFLPRPLRLAFFGGSALSCLIATLLAAARLAAELSAPEPLLVAPALEGAAAAGPAGAATDVVVNVIGMAVFAGLFVWDRAQQEKRVERRRVVREKQVRGGGAALRRGRAGGLNRATEGSRGPGKQERVLGLVPRPQGSSSALATRRSPRLPLPPTHVRRRSSLGTARCL